MKIFIQSMQLVKNMANVTWYELTFAVCIKSLFQTFFHLSVTGHHTHTEISSFMPVSYYGGPQLSRQNQKPHGKNKIPHGKTKNLVSSKKKPWAYVFCSFPIRIYREWRLPFVAIVIFLSL